MSALAKDTQPGEEVLRLDPGQPISLCQGGCPGSQEGPGRGRPHPPTPLAVAPWGRQDSLGLAISCRSSPSRSICCSTSRWSLALPRGHRREAQPAWLATPTRPVPELGWLEEEAAVQEKSPSRGGAAGPLTCTSAPTPAAAAAASRG